MFDGLDSMLAIRRLTPESKLATQRFYDTSPLSPSGRYLAYTEFRFDDRLPVAGDAADVVVVELETLAEVYRSETLAWDTQLGAQVQWGADDRALLFNRLDTSRWHPYAVVVDLDTSEERALQGPVYMVSPDGNSVLSPNLRRIWLVQPGYGVLSPAGSVSHPEGAEDDDGLFVTDVASGESRLALSFREIYEAMPDAFRKVNLRRGGFYGFHVKWSPDGTKIMFIVRWRNRSSRSGHSLNWLVTMNSSFRDLKVAVMPDRWRGGHHPNWCPDSEHIVMNLAFPRRRFMSASIAHFLDRVAGKVGLPGYRPLRVLRFARLKYDGTGLEVIAPDVVGSGHPTWHQSMSGVLSDAYPWESVADQDGSSPIRWVTSDQGAETTIVKTRTWPEYMGPRREWRVDPHPAWNVGQTAFTFNAAPGGVRGIFFADFSSYLQLTSETQSSA